MDFLKVTANKFGGEVNRRDDDMLNDQIGSNTATPTGAATPQPDAVDKRVPSILHGFFGQVGTQSFTTLPDQHIPSLLQHEAIMPPAKDKSDLARAAVPPAAPHSPPDSADEKEQGNTAEASRQGGEGSHTQLPSTSTLNDSRYPTPPPSSSSSLKQKEKEDSIRSRIAQASMTGAAASRPTVQRQPSAVDALSLNTRRHAPKKSLTGLITASSVHAAYLSNPTSRSATTPNTPDQELPLSALTSLASIQSELTRLTDGAVPKNTPPRTPRALSNDVPKGSTDTQQPSSPPAAVQKEASTTNKPEETQLKEGFNTPLPVEKQRGKLSVRISEGRGLRPSFDPYVVCVFESNEYISKGPLSQEDAEKINGSSQKLRGGGVPIKRSVSDMGRPMAIPMKSHNGSDVSLSEQFGSSSSKHVTDPVWDQEVVFDVLAEHPNIDFFIYDRSEQETFLGHLQLQPNVVDNNSRMESWYKLQPRDSVEESVSGELKLRLQFQTTEKKHYSPQDFQLLKLIGKGTFGQVFQVRKKDTQRIYAMKVLSKKVIVQKKEVAHTLGERNILVRTAQADSPFIVALKFSFQTEADLYLVTDFMSGGELFWHLQKEGRFNETRAKFYIAELILALEHLHKHDIVYRDLKPENILLDANGHIALCDFGLSKANLTKNDTTNTFCGTTEYLAPEVLLDEQGYTTMVDFWSLGVLVFEMCCGWSPFYADDTQQMYKNIAFGKVRFPRDALSTEGRNFVKGLLNRNPKHRLGAKNDAEELKAHPFFRDIDWTALTRKTVVPPFKPKLKSILDTSNFDPEFTNALENSSSLNARAAALASGNVPASTPLSPGMQANFRGFTFVDESNLEEQYRGTDLERMDEDDNEGENKDDEWEMPFDGANKAGNRMSGIVKTTSPDDGVFNNPQFDE
ncbi:hypothetical protein MMC25_007699 [Agyrium rufum]|nr:hypothetical protein [Agyrium rufum]